MNEFTYEVLLDQIVPFCLMIHLQICGKRDKMCNKPLDTIVVEAVL